MRQRKIFLGLIGLILVVTLVFTGLIVANYKHIGTLLKVSALVKDQYIEEVNTAKLVDGAIKGLVDSLEDPYSVYLEPKMFDDLQVQIQGTFGGVGITVGMQEDRLVVIAPIKGTPAYKAGIKSGDIIAKIDKTDTKGITLDQAVDLMRGKEGTKVIVTMERKGEPKPLVFNIVREIIIVPSVEGEVLEDNIGYVHITNFSTTTSEDLDKVFKEIDMDKLSGLILDLRNNPGGELTAATQVAQHFVPKGPIVSIVYRDGQKEVYESDAEGFKKPLVVLVNEGSASASEIVAGAIKDTKVGTLVGIKTFGKGVVQTVYPLGNGAGLKLTVAKYLTPKGTDIHKKGIEPNIKIQQPEIDAEKLAEMNIEDIKDVQLEKAIEVLKTKLK